jgi:polyisoprenoid-binding protein YceI
MGFFHFAFVSLLLWAGAAYYAETTYYIDAGSKLTLEGSSNVNKFTCACNDQFPQSTLRFELFEEGKSAKFSNAMLTLRTKSLDCGNAQMNKDMYKTLRADQHPHIKIELTRTQLLEASTLSTSEWTPLKATSALTISGVKKPVVFEVKAKKVGKDRIRLTASREVLMSDYGIEPPTAMLGLIKVNNAIRLNLDLIIVTVGNAS